MSYPLNWTNFFTKPAKASFSLKSQYDDLRRSCQKLFKLSFTDGLRVIVTSMPDFEHHDWLTFRSILQDLIEVEGNAHAWLEIAHTMRELLPEVKRILQRETLQESLSQITYLLNEEDELGQFALFACLYHFVDDELKAQMIFQHLLQHYDYQSQALELVRKFFYQLIPIMR